ncbi:MAG: hypothetical protein AB8B96_02770 [Lysobacterales bacterium]
MQTVYQGLIWIHVVIGFVGLTAFWFPVFSRKGGKLHRQMGKVYVYCAYVVLATAGSSVLYQLFRFLGPERSIAEHPNSFAAYIFLGYLSLVTFLSVHHGFGVLRFKGQPNAMSSPLRMGLAISAMVASAGVIAFALIFKPGNAIVLLALSPIGILGGWGIINYLRSTDLSPKEWMYEHIGSMLGGGIAFHTAFMVFGANRLMDLGLSGWQQVIPWVLPSIIGIPASILWTRHYRLKFSNA